MRSAVITLSRPGSAIGGEDQVGQYLVESFRRHGWDSVLFYEHESCIMQEMDFDLVLSNGARCKTQNKNSVYWHFNERIDIMSSSVLKDLGYKFVATNSKKCMQEGPSGKFYLPLAADVSMIQAIRKQPGPNFKVAYIGNWNGYKGNKVNEWLIPLAERYNSEEFAIYGGSRWSEHPVLGSYWKGILPKEEWVNTPNISDSWICFRSPQQADLNMTTDRPFWLAAAGVNNIVSDMPVSEELEGFINWAESPLEALALIENPIQTCGTMGQMHVSQNHTYDQRVKEILRQVMPHVC